MAPTDLDPGHQSREPSPSRDPTRARDRPASRDPSPSRDRSPARESSPSRVGSKSRRKTVSRDSSIRSSGSVGGVSQYIIRPFGFDSRTSYDATESLLTTRSATYVRPAPVRDDNIWRLPPPDFRPRCYDPQPPPRNSREAIQPWKYADRSPKDTERVDITHSAPLRLPSILCEKPKQEVEFVTSFKIPGPWEAKIATVKDGGLGTGEYEMPKPYDFRGYPRIEALGLPEFVTQHERDPYNLKFISQNLDILPGDGPVRREERDIGGPQMAPPLPPQLRWDRNLILDRDPFPNKYHAFTRHRRFDRSAHSALMDRVEEKLNAAWAKRELEKQLNRDMDGRQQNFRSFTALEHPAPDDVTLSTDAGK